LTRISTFWVCVTNTDLMTSRHRRAIEICVSSSRRLPAYSHLRASQYLEKNHGAACALAPGTRQ
jgi:hypothetical protein